MTAAQFKSNLTWEVLEQPVFLASGKEVKGQKALVRSDNENILYVTKESYNLMNIAEFTGVVEKLSDITGMEIVGYDDFAGGKKVMAYLKKLSDEGDTLFGSEMSYYMTVGNGYDYLTPFFVGVATSYTRCNNQFGRVQADNKIRHTASKDYKLEELFQYYENYAASQAGLNQNFQRMIDRKINLDEKEAFLDFVLEIPVYEPAQLKANPELAKIGTRKQHMKEELGLAVSRESQDVGRTVWGLFNGATYWTTHVRQTKNKSFGNLFGSDAEYNQRAFTFCNQLLSN